MNILRMFNLLIKKYICTFEYSIHSKNKYSKKTLKINDTNIIKKYIEYIDEDIDDILDIVCGKNYFMIYRDENNYSVYVIFLDGVQGYWILETSKNNLLNLLTDISIFYKISIKPTKYNFKKYTDKGI